MRDIHIGYLTGYGGYFTVEDRNGYSFTMLYRDKEDRKGLYVYAKGCITTTFDYLKNDDCPEEPVVYELGKDKMGRDRPFHVQLAADHFLLESCDPALRVKIIEACIKNDLVRPFCQGVKKNIEKLMAVILESIDDPATLNKLFGEIASVDPDFDFCDPRLREKIVSVCNFSLSEDSSHKVLPRYIFPGNIETAKMYYPFVNDACKGYFFTYVWERNGFIQEEQAAQFRELPEFGGLFYKCVRFNDPEPLVEALSDKGGVSADAAYETIFRDDSSFGYLCVIWKYRDRICPDFDLTDDRIRGKIASRIIKYEYSDRGTRRNLFLENLLDGCDSDSLNRLAEVYLPLTGSCYFSSGCTAEIVLSNPDLVDKLPDEVLTKFDDDFPEKLKNQDHELFVKWLLRQWEADKKYHFYNGLGDFQKRSFWINMFRYADFEAWTRFWKIFRETVFSSDFDYVRFIISLSDMIGELKPDTNRGFFKAVFDYESSEDGDKAILAFTMYLAVILNKNNRERMDDTFRNANIYMVEKIQQTNGAYLKNINMEEDNNYISRFLKTITEYVGYIPCKELVRSRDVRGIDQYVKKLVVYSKNLDQYHDSFYCRECKKTLVPVFGVKSLNLFSCPDGSHSDNQGVYINHCLRCNSLIDSRDCKKQDNSKYWLCMTCGGSSEIKPGTICPSCGAGISSLYQDLIDCGGKSYKFICRRCGWKSVESFSERKYNIWTDPYDPYYSDY